MQVKLPPRLKKITELIKKNSRVADIGTDHGYIPIYLIENRITPHVIASDVNRGPLDTAKSNIKSHGYNQQVELRLGSGLEVLVPGEVDTVIMAGMGGMLIKELLEAAPAITHSIDTLILQPMQAQQELRRYLVSNGYEIVQDLLVREDFRIYEIIIAKKGKQVVEDEIYYEIGFHIKLNPKELALAFIIAKIKNQQEIISSVEGETSVGAKKKLRECRETLEKLEEVLRWLKK
ncbi:tRNA (adenine22-N1)-methyltransferase [Natronincola peptidivorans]|uniref:tRNA (Adenine22-N1)-methyltransferase n=1 Tax=Natronincola peptidivorans TaxID=426128 RepID=A0A1H9Y4L4_9FIRM|nr:class I SAM-dependent methyltransferase [Natronincola peptidivorans]SES63643.1 tRNA (adenine22-N1)-methyltransferase [Natronincola peptidivorans]